MTVLLELAEINVLFIICSLPVITAGAAYTAMLQSLYELNTKGEGCFSARRFLRTVVMTFKKTVLWWCGGLLFEVILIYGMLYWQSVLQGSVRVVMCGVYGVACILIFGFLQHFFFFLALTERSDRIVWKNCFLLTLAKFPLVLIRGALTASLLLVFAMNAAMFLRMLPLILLYWISCPAYACVILLMKELKPLFPELFIEKEL